MPDRIAELTRAGSFRAACPPCYTEAAGGMAGQGPYRGQMRSMRDDTCGTGQRLRACPLMRGA